MKKVTITSDGESRLGPSYKITKKDKLMQGCYLCEDGARHTNLEKEHVLPKVLFTPDSCGDPLVLRACSLHNREKAKLDEFAARILQLTADNSSSKRYERWLERSRKSFQQMNIQPGGRLLKEIMDSLAFRDITTPAGIVLQEKQPSIKIDDGRMNDFFTNIVKGLTVAETGRFYNWNDYDFHFDSAQTLNSSNRLMDNPEHPLYMAFRNRQYVREWSGIFSFFGTVVRDEENDDRYAATWGMVAYGTYAILALVIPKEDSIRGPRIQP